MAQVAQELVDTHQVILDGYVNEKKARRIIRELRGIHEDDPAANVEFTITSPGGDVSGGTAIYSELVAMSERKGGTHHVTTLVRGMAGSIASLIFQAGDVRMGGALDVLVLHEQTVYFDGEWLSNAVQQIQDLLKWQDKYIDILMERATAPRSLIEQLEGPKDRRILMHEAVALGLADRVENEHAPVRTVA
jgi:ATP-dependent protease ClpP protease subunit